MSYAALKVAHVLAVLVWVGGMFFAHFFLRPELAALEPPQRLRLMHGVLRRFFAAVSVAVVVTLASGLAMIAMARGGPGFAMPLGWIIMSVVGLIMMAVFVLIRRWPYPALGAAIGRSDWPAAAAALATIRTLVTLNLTLGLGIFIVAVAG